MTQTPATPAAPYRILTTGSRNWDDEYAVWNALASVHDYWDGTRPVVVVYGACPTGADALADQWCARAGVPVERYPADWGRYGKSAGLRRNQQMVDTRPDVCLAFIRDASPGASHCVDAAQAAGIEVFREIRTSTAPTKYARAVTPAGDPCDCPGCSDPHTTVCMFGGQRWPAGHTPPVTPAPPGDQPAMSTPPITADRPSDQTANVPAAVTAEPGGRLEALLAEYERLKPLVDAAVAHLKEITDGIKVEVTSAAPETPRVDITSPVLSTPLRLQAKTTWRLDTKRMKQENPLLYVTYAYQSTAWELRAAPAAAAS